MPGSAIRTPSSIAISLSALMTAAISIAIGQAVEQALHPMQSHVSELSSASNFSHTILNQSNDAIGPIGHGLGHGTTTSAALAMKTPPEVLFASTNNRFTKIDVRLRRRLPGCIGWIRFHGYPNYHRPQASRIDLSQAPFPIK